jgi:hypothetical protein
MPFLLIHQFREVPSKVRAYLLSRPLTWLARKVLDSNLPRRIRRKAMHYLFRRRAYGLIDNILTYRLSKVRALGSKSSQDSGFECLNSEQVLLRTPPEAFRRLTRTQLMRNLEYALSGYQGFCHYRDETHYQSLLNAGSQWLKAGRPDPKNWPQLLTEEEVEVLSDYLGPCLYVEDVRSLV